MNYCSNCGYRLMENSNFCPNCGKSFSRQNGVVNSINTQNIVQKESGGSLALVGVISF